jgi:hypothetical protein
VSKILRNTTASPITVVDVGSVIIPASPGSYTIPAQDYWLWAASSNVITFIGDGDLVVNDGSFDLNISDGTDLIKGLYPRFRTTPTVQNVTITLANTEQSHVLPTGSGPFMIHNRGPGIVKLAFVSGASGTTYFTLHRWSFFQFALLAQGSTTIYVQSPTASTVVELIIGT